MALPLHGVFVKLDYHRLSMIGRPDWAAKLCPHQSDSYSGVHANGAQASAAVSRPVSIQIERKRQNLRLEETLQNYTGFACFVCLSAAEYCCMRGCLRATEVWQTRNKLQ